LKARVLGIPHDLRNPHDLKNPHFQTHFQAPKNAETPGLDWLEGRFQVSEGIGLLLAV